MLVTRVVGISIDRLEALNSIDDGDGVACIDLLESMAVENEDENPIIQFLTVGLFKRSLRGVLKMKRKSNREAIVAENE